jgi:hypothetical protein
VRPLPYPKPNNSDIQILFLGEAKDENDNRKVYAFLYHDRYFSCWKREGFGWQFLPITRKRAEEKWADKRPRYARIPRRSTEHGDLMGEFLAACLADGFFKPRRRK